MSSLILQNEPVSNGSHPKTPLDNIHFVMMENHATELGSQNHKIYQTLLLVHNQSIQLYWRFQHKTNNNIKVCIRPNLTDGVYGNFRPQNQRNFVDLLRAIGVCNRDKNKSFSYMVTQYGFIQLCTIFSAQDVAKPMGAKKLVKSTNMHLLESIARLMTLLKPFLENRNHSDSLQSVSKTSKMVLERNFNLLLATRFNKIKNEELQKKEKYNSRQPVQSEEILAVLDRQRQQVHKKFNDCLKMLRFTNSYMQNQTCSVLSVYNQWIVSQKQQPKNKKNELKNVHGVRVLYENRISIDRNREGSHCKIVVSQFKVVLMISVNRQTNKAFEQMKQKEERLQLPTNVEKVEKQIFLVKKLLINPDKLQSKNSFDNELEFILYIKERGFKYISTYYWQFQKKRTQMQTILLHYYPQNLRQMIHNQGKYLSVRQKLSLVQQITSAVNWLSSNYVCHRDIKPQNIMIDENRVPKLIDFGSCCPINGNGNSHFRVKDTRLLGTPKYHHAYEGEMKVLYNRNEYEQHILFDAYSLGKVFRDIFIEGLTNLLPNMQELVNYMIERCEEQNPADRMTYQQMLFLFDSFIKYLDQREAYPK